MSEPNSCDAGLLQALESLTLLIRNMRDVYGSKAAIWIINSGSYARAEAAIRIAKERKTCQS